MDVSQELLIDIGLNLVGYLAAGFLLILLYSLFTKSGKAKVVSQMTETDPACPTPSDVRRNQTAELKTDSSVEFIEFGNSEGVNGNEPAQQAARPRQATENYRRKRLKIISTARQMLNAGTPENKVKSLLPISDAELSLLMIGKG